MLKMLVPVRNFIFKQAYLLGLHKLFINRNDNCINVLCLHRVSDDLDPLFTPISIDNFRLLIRLLKKHFTFISFRDILSSSLIKQKRPKLILTFDDGYKDFLENALPILTSEKVPANLNVVVDCAENGSIIWTQRLNNLICHLHKTSKRTTFIIDNVSICMSERDSLFQVKKKIFGVLSKMNYEEILHFINTYEIRFDFVQPSVRMMTWNDILECAGQGIEIGSHSYYHSPLIDESTILEKEIFHSKTVIEDKLGQEIDIFSFPNGIVSKKAFEMAVDSGYKILLFIENNNLFSHYSLSKNGAIYHRKLVYHPSPYEIIFYILNFHSSVKLN